MVKAVAAILSAGITPAEYAVLWHVRDTVVQPRESIAGWTASNLPNNVPPDITIDDCLQAVDSLIRRGLLVELSTSDLEADLARWRGESLPVSWGVDRDRYAGDVDLTETGFRLMESITQHQFPDLVRPPRTGYNDEAPGLIRVFGETEESCKLHVKYVVDRIHETPWRWPRGSFELEPMRPLGPWWYARFERVPAGFEVAVRSVQRPDNRPRR